MSWNGNLHRTCLLGLGVLLALVGIALGQQLTGSVQGVVTDASGAVIPGATMQVVSVDNGSSQTGTSDAQGNFHFAAINPGAYTLKASFAGFKTTTRKITVELNKTLRADVQLETGEVTTSVDVSAAAAAIDPASTNVATNLGTKVINDLPIMTRDITVLVELIPGTRQAVGTTAGGSQVMDISGNYAQGDGTRRSQSTFYVDGSENMGGWRNQANQMPNPDAVSEVQVVSSSASAEFGKQPGISLNALTKSGTNHLHGSAMLAAHWDGLNANTWSANLNGAARPADKQKWMTGTLGGPVFRNKTFFFVSFQRFQDATPGQQSIYRMPTPAMVNGDFSGISGFSIKTINPDTGLPFGQTIPSKRINPIAANLAKRFPTIPQYSNDPVLGRFFWQYYDTVANNEGLVKIDHRLTDRQQISVSYMSTGGGQIRPDNVSGLTNYVPDWGGNSLTDARQHTLSGRHTWTRGSNLVVENRFAFSRLHSGRSRTEQETLTSLGLIWPDVNPGVEHTLPTFGLSGGPTARGGQYSDLLQQNFRGLSNLTWLRGRHALKFGGEIQDNQYSRFINYDNAHINFTGTYSFTSGPLNGPWPTLSVPTGDLQFAYSWADFLLGQVNSFDATGVQNGRYSGLATFYFAQDEWRLHKNVTLTAGLRYELYGTQKSANMLAGYVDGHKSAQYPTVPVGLAFETDPGIPAGMRKPDRNNVAPRLGAAWDTFGKGKLIVRAGGGLYYAYPPLSIVEQLGSVLNASTQTGNYANLSDPWGTANPSSGSTAYQFTGGVMPSFSRDPTQRKWDPMNIIGFDPNAATPYQWQFNISAETRLFNGLAVQGGYIGNRAKKGWSVRDNNLPIWQPGANTGNVNTRRPNQLWRQINLITSDMGETYDAGQFIVTYSKPWIWARFTYSLQHWLTTATGDANEVGTSNAPTDWASNPRNIKGDLASVVPRQYVRFNVIYTLPRFGNAFTKKYVGGWQVAGTGSWYDGDNLNVTLGKDTNFDAFSSDRPDQVGPIVYPRTASGGVTTWFLPGAFANPPDPSATNPYPFGSLPRNAVRGPGRFYMDGSISKTTTLTEALKLQLRVDFSNMLNHPNLSNPTVAFTSADFGLIRTKDGGGRTAQAQLKLIF
jgi:hypothetical protein